MTRLKVSISILSSLTISLIAFAANEKDARADEPIGFSLGLERVGGLAYSNIKPSGSDTMSLSSFSIAGVSANPVALPRLGADVILPLGLTLGGAVAFGYASLSDSPSNGGDSTAIHGSAWLISPRVGYRLRPTSFLDITPHLGATLADASVSLPTTNCSFDSATGTQGACVTGSNSTSIFLVAISVEVVAALRMTKSFNLLVGASYDHVISASGSNGSSDGNGTSTSSDANVDGRYLGAQLWLGLGGYVF